MLQTEYFLGICSLCDQEAVLKENDKVFKQNSMSFSLGTVSSYLPMSYNSVLLKMTFLCCSAAKSCDLLIVLLGNTTSSTDSIVISFKLVSSEVTLTDSNGSTSTSIVAAAKVLVLAIALLASELSDGPVMVVAGAFMVSVSCKDKVESAALLVPAVRLLMLLEVAPVFGLVQLRIDDCFA